jgi:cellulose synthase/poly-beta-1,6-N-acetylglucosamine synthase-like glycosyltransferase
MLTVPRTQSLVGASPKPPALVRTSAVVFAFEEVAALRRSLACILASPVDEVLVMYGGTDGSKAFVESLQDPRLLTEYEAERSGKWRAFNRAIRRVHGEVVFLISGDIEFDPSILSRLSAQVTGDVGVVIPRVVPTNVRGPVSRLGATLWDLHDAQIMDCARRGLPFHGGELQAVRRTVLEEIDGVVNEDAYLCFRALERGYRVVYDRGAVVHNTVPETLKELVAQRARVNYGHRQLVASGREPSTLDRFAFRRPLVALEVVTRAVRKRPINALWIPLLAGVEGLAMARGYRDFARRIDYSRWTLIQSGKGRPFHSDD